MSRFSVLRRGARGLKLTAHIIMLSIALCWLSKPMRAQEICECLWQTHPQAPDKIYNLNSSSVGIGDFSQSLPEYRLDVKGSIQVCPSSPEQWISLRTCGNLDAFLINSEAVNFTAVRFNNRLWFKNINDDSVVMALKQDGRVGIGTLSPKAAAQLHILNDSDTQTKLLLSNADEGASSVPMIHFRDLVSSDDWVFVMNGADLNIQNEVLPGDIDENVIMTLKPGGRVGVGTSLPQSTFHVVGTTTTDGLNVVDTASASTLGVSGTTTTGDLNVGNLTTTAELTVNGTTTTGVLEITGGSDLAEPFEISGADDQRILPGMVACIDSDRPGQLRISSSAYDRTVVGVISGAGGVSAGLVMKQTGAPMADGSYPIALTGRVYVRADADQGAIIPGDLLTTSATPGHVMKVADYGEANGAVLGKAMTGLEEGVGLVLMVVALQ